METKKLQERKIRAKKLITALEKRFRQEKTGLRHKNPWQLAVAVMLSAQCTDKKVNEVTKTLFKKYPTLDSYVHANPKEFEQDIRPTGFYKNKTKHILASARMLQKDYNGKVPASMTELLKFPGIARKTANVILGNAFGIAEGIAVDTHVKRLAQKFDLTDHTDPDRIEHDLMEIIPKSKWFACTNLFISYGRNVCPARKHACKEHFLSKIFPKAAATLPKR